MKLVQSVVLLFVTVSEFFHYAEAVSAVKDPKKSNMVTTPEQLRSVLRKQRRLDEMNVNGTSGDNESGDGVEDAGDGITAGSPCFSSFNEVEVHGKGMVSIKDIQVGDYVRATISASASNNKNNNNGGIEEEFSRVFSLAHLDHNFETEFLQIYVNGYQTKPLEITGKHMLFVATKGKGGFVRADKVSVGDMLGSDQKVVVSEIKSIKRTGVYAPITKSGEIIVSGLRASSYYEFLDSISASPLLNQHTMSHFFFAPHRLICSYDFKLCENEGHTEGYTNYAYRAIKIAEACNDFIAPVQFLLAILAYPFLSTLYALEQATIYPFAAFAILGYMIYKSTSRKQSAYLK